MEIKVQFDDDSKWKGTHQAFQREFCAGCPTAERYFRWPNFWHHLNRVALGDTPETEPTTHVKSVAPTPPVQAKKKWTLRKPKATTDSESSSSGTEGVPGNVPPPAPDIEDTLGAAADPPTS